VWQNPLHHRILEVESDIAKHECICIFDILYSSYPRMYPSHPLNASITIRINKNAHFSDSDMLHDSRSINNHQHHVHDTALRLCLWQQPSASLNMENPGTERQAFFSLSKCIEDMNHQCECVAPCKLSKEKLPCDTKFDNVRVRSYPQIRTPNKQVLIESIPFLVMLNRQWMIADHRELTA